ncbi:hypothetical protein GUITHDRAFT_118627 [Guillardia theta CCMP2712]|uniref:YprB ribonuclease H-like domain-containing protein n=1 Tax=Guillardia theta (strain CCMP2712) TaxID=905079 RepID=L1IH79_GUITC|nr:hypothetical protein GUITHDRAFT_118627 [Guillardia theta CCMP2712]EKX35185.1 hypothetical protein GUITHDRAFT_118627 [Guillardia theta CCMP2712]|eukprot:XP_005822165.1 hypothetical protein GUITHDRAFT_118627 [Guillardia theta CCMP2712]
MLAFDIETTGLNFYKDSITCICIYDPAIGKEKSFHFTVGDFKEKRERAEEFMRELDDADQICTFNGIQFDIPFVQVQFKADPDRVAMWLLKTVDIFHKYKSLHNHTFSLDSALMCNNLKTKTSNGYEAVKMAKEGRLKELEEYCMMDTKLTYELTMLPYFNAPEQKTWKKH